VCFWISHHQGKSEPRSLASPACGLNPAPCLLMLDPSKKCQGREAAAKQVLAQITWHRGWSSSSSSCCCPQHNNQKALLPGVGGKKSSSNGGAAREAAGPSLEAPAALPSADLRAAVAVLAGLLAQLAVLLPARCCL